MSAPNMFTEFLTELKSVAATASNLENPEAGVFNQLTSVQGAKGSFIEDIRKGSLALPLQIFSIGEFGEDTNLALNSVGWMIAPVTIIYVCKWGVQGNQDFCFQNAAAIKAAIDNPFTRFNTFSRREEGRLLTNVDAPLNRELFANSNAQIIASAVLYQPGLRVCIAQPSS